MQIKSEDILKEKTETFGMYYIYVTSYASL